MGQIFFFENLMRFFGQLSTCSFRGGTVSIDDLYGARFYRPGFKSGGKIFAVLTAPGQSSVLSPARFSQAIGETTSLLATMRLVANALDVARHAGPNRETAAAGSGPAVNQHPFLGQADNRKIDVQPNRCNSARLRRLAPFRVTMNQIWKTNCTAFVIPSQVFRGRVRRDYRAFCSGDSSGFAGIG